MEAIGRIKIEDIDKDFTNPTLEVNALLIECIFIDENGDKYSRLKEIDLSLINIEDAILTNEELIQFN